MAHSTRSIGIAIASIIAIGCIIIAVLISGPLPFHLATANAESTHDLLVAYAAKDSDNDGLPDWEEALYGTDPNNPHSISPTLTDSQAVAQGLVKPKFATATSTPAVDPSSLPGTLPAPQTLTDQFARALFGQYLSQRDPNNPPTPDEIATFVEQAVASLEASDARTPAYTQANVHISGSGSDALVAYTANAEKAFASHTTYLPESATDYLGDAIQKNDTGALKHVAEIGAAYTAIAKAYVAVPVPSEAAGPHLAFANALANLGVDVTDMAAVNADPVRGYLGLANYEKDAAAVSDALVALQKVYAAEQVTIPDGVTGSSLYARIMNAQPSTP